MELLKSRKQDAYYLSKGIFSLISILLLSACSTLSKQQCNSDDWQEYGRIDASRGRPETFLSEHENACGANESKALQYKKGWSDGLKEFCSRDTAFHLGSNGYRHPDYCPQEFKQTFDENFSKGEKVWPLKKELAGLNEHLKKVEENEKYQAEHKSDFEQVMTLFKDPRIAELKYSTIVRNQRDALKDKIAKLEEGYPKPAMFAQSEDVESARPQLGAWVGTFVGFGSGHGIQGRYGKKGWWYTVGEIGSFFIPGGGAILGFLGFKVWESVDVWNFSYQSSLGYPDLNK